MSGRACARCGVVGEWPQDGYLCPSCRPERACLDCGGSLAGRARNASYCTACAVQRATAPRRRTTCLRCGLPLSPMRGARAIRCLSCAAIVEAEAAAACHRRAREREPKEPPRDVQLEARIDAHLRRIRASGRFRLSDEVIWARRTDVLAERAGGWEDVGLLSREKTRGWRRQTKAHKAAVEAGQAAAVAAVDREDA